MIAIFRFCSRSEARSTTCVSLVDMDLRKRVSIFDVTPPVCSLRNTTQPQISSSNTDWMPPCNVFSYP